MKSHARELLQEYNALAYEQKEEKISVLKQLFGEIGTNVSVGLPFICDYGRNIYVGNNVSVNMNCTFVDCNTITIGDNVLIASNVQLERRNRTIFLPYLRIAHKNRKWLLVGWRCYCSSGCNNR